MYIYLPIAEMPLNVFLLLGIGAGIGFMSGLFGVGGGFLITPLLIFLGIPPAVAAATGANTVIAPSVSGVLAHMRRRTVDFRMGAILLVGGLAGSAASVWMFGVLSRLGQIDLVVSLSYVLMLGAVGTLMLIESLRALRRRQKTAGAARGKLHQHIWLHGLPFKLRFPKSRLYISVLLPAGLGFAVGVLSGIMGVGGGFIMVPAMIYLLGMPTSVVVGTSLFQIIFVSANVTFLQSYAHQSVDIVLAAILMIGGAAAAPLGARIGAKLHAEQMRILMALLVLAVAVQLAVGLVVTPRDLYSIRIFVTPGDNADRQ
ncbi:MAG: sulfite exporter TauE/SafE family protein [Rhodospirillales bacterium]|nr:sulfite exporter TauE/SafE family protein [Rhodospirillales bacterium]